MTDYDKAIEALGRLHSSRADDRDDWMSVGRALHSVDQSGSMLETWKSWSSQSNDYDERECERQWRHMRADKGTGLGTLLMMAKEDGGGNTPSAPHSKPKRDSAPAPVLKPQRRASREQAIRVLARQTRGKFAAARTCDTENGEPWFEVLRFNLESGKTFRPLLCEHAKYVL